MRAAANSPRGLVALIGAAILFASTGAFVETLSRYFTEPGQLVVRSAIAVAMVVFLSRLMRVKFSITRDQVKYLVAIGFLYALSTSCFVYAVTSLKASTALFMLYVGVIVATQIMGALLFREGFGRKNIIALVVIGLALFMYMQPIQPASFSFGIIIAFIGGVCEAISYAVRKGRAAITKESVTAAQSIGGLAIGVVFLLWNAQEIMRTSVSPISIVLITILGAIYVGIGYLITYGMRHYELSMGSVILSSDMLFALIINTIFLHQAPTAYEVAGSALIFLCIIYTAGFSDEEEKAPEAELPDFKAVQTADGES